MISRLAGLYLAFAMTFSPAFAAEIRTITDDLGRTVDIPAAPRRIAALDDLRLSVPLIELGVTPVASHGREEGYGPYIRSSLMLTGVDFSNSEIAFLGNAPLDIEALAAAGPDLVITLVSRDSPIEQLETIAPVVVFDLSETDPFAIYAKLAELTGTEDALARLDARYDAQLDQLRRLVDTSAITVAVMQGSGGEISVQHTYGSLGRVLRDAGFTFPAIIDDLAPGETAGFSAEFLPDFDADFIFDTYRNDRNETPEDASARMREVFEDYCAQLWACAHGQYVFLPRDEPYAISYQSLSSMTYAVLALMSAQDIVTRQD